MSESYQHPNELEWFQKVESWKRSGKKAAAWCRENQVHYVLFLRWRRRFYENNLSPKSPSEFIELKNRPQINAGTGISFECSGVHIHLGAEFNIVALSKCLDLLRGISC